MSDSLQPHEPQHTRPPCSSPTPGVHLNPCPLSQWCHPIILSSVVPFSSCPQSFPASGSFQMSQLFVSGGQSIGVSASTSVLPMNTQDWSPLGWTGWISLQSKGLSRVFSNTSPTQFKSINYSVLSFLYSPTLACLISLLSPFATFHIDPNNYVICSGSLSSVASGRGRDDVFWGYQGIYLHSFLQANQAFSLCFFTMLNKTVLFPLSMNESMIIDCCLSLQADITSLVQNYLWSLSYGWDVVLDSRNEQRFSQSLWADGGEKVGPSYHAWEKLQISSVITCPDPLRLHLLLLWMSLWTVACQTPLSMGFSRQEYWNGLPCPSPGDLPNPVIEQGLLHCRQILYQLSYEGSPHPQHPPPFCCSLPQDSASMIPLPVSFLTWIFSCLTAWSFRCLVKGIPLRNHFLNTVVR